MKKVFSVLLSLVMLMSLLSVGVAVSAATPDTQVIEAAAGETIKIKFSEDNCYGVSGAIEYSNRNLFSSLNPGGTTSYGKITENAFILSSADKVTCEVILTVKISENAKVGDTCVVSFTDCELVENNEDFTGRSGYTKSVTVKVVKKETPSSSSTTKTEPSKTEPSKTQPSKTEPSKTEPSKTQPSKTQPSKTQPSKLPTRPGYTGTTNGALDYTRLIEQINIAQALNERDWTNESWAELESALNYAFQVLYNATTQKEIDDAADALAEAIANLVPIDGQALRDLIDEILDGLKKNDKEGLFADLYDALAKAKDALESGDQQAIADAYDALKKAFDALKLKWPELFGDKEVIVEAEAEECDESCHVWNSKFWKSKTGHILLVILLIISVVINLAFIALLIWYLIKRKKKAEDKVPQVDYDINDD